MFGSLPRLHRWVVIVVSGIAGAVLGAWISDLAATHAGYACAEVLLGVCIGSTLNLLPVVAGTSLGLLLALVLVYNPDDPHRATSRSDGDELAP